MSKQDLAKQSLSDAMNELTIAMMEHDDADTKLGKAKERLNRAKKGVFGLMTENYTIVVHDNRAYQVSVGTNKIDPLPTVVC